MIIWIDQPFANDHQKGTTSCKLSSRRTGLLWMMIRIDRPLANDHLDRPAACKWSSETSHLLQMIFWMDRPLANDHPDGPPSCKWSSFSVFVVLLLCKNIFLLQIRSSFSSAVNLFPWKKDYFLSPNKFLIFLSQFCSPSKKIHLYNNII